MTRAIDFRALRSQLSFPTILAYYNIRGKEKGGDQWQGYCPLPTHVRKGDGGVPRSPSFSVDLARGLYNCFGCGGRGNVLKFVVRMEGFDPEDGRQFRDGAVRAVDLFLGGERAQGNPVESTSNTLAARPRNATTKEEAELPVVVNAPLDFTFPVFDTPHPYLQERGFTPETAAHFGLGFAHRGLMKNRIVIPLKNHDRTLVGYAGRLVDDTAVDEDNPKYRLPGSRERDGKKFVFRKSDLLYYPDELQRCQSKCLFLVEGFPSVWWFWQHGIPCVAAVMGSSISERQGELVCALTTNDARIVLIPDGDDSGMRLALAALPLISPHRFVRWVRLSDKMQPTDWSGEELAAMVKSVLA